MSAEKGNIYYKLAIYHKIVRMGGGGWGVKLK